MNFNAQGFNSSNGLRDMVARCAISERFDGEFDHDFF
jgi:hypothetical protein